VQAPVPAERPLRLEVVVTNVGNAQAEDVQVSLWAGETPAAEPILLGAMPAGEERRLTLTASEPVSPLPVVQVRSQGVLLDSFLFEVPNSSAVVQSQPVASQPLASGPALSLTKTGKGFAALVIVLGVLVVGVLAVGGLWFAGQSRRTGGLAPAVATLTVGTLHFTLPATGAEIGRSPECLICLADPEVSRHHARLDWNAGSWVITDLGSTNGVYVNGRYVQKQALQHGDEIRVGTIMLRFSH